MSSEELLAQVCREHADNLASVHRELFAISGGHRLVAGVATIGPVDSVVSPFSLVTIIATVAPESAVYPDGARPGQILTISLSAQHRSMDVRTPVDVDEGIAWARAITGPDWEHGLYRASTFTDTVRTDQQPRHLTQRFAAFLTPGGATQAPPPDKLHQFRPLPNH